MTHKSRPGILLLIACLLLSLCLPALAAQEETPAAEQGIVVKQGTLDFVYKNRVLRHKEVTYYDNVYAYNHNEYVVIKFDASVPSQYFVQDGLGDLAIAPIVLDITDAVRIALYGGDVGKLGLLYGQYTEEVRSADGKLGFSGIHEGLDFIAKKDQPLYAIVGGTVLRTGRDSNGTVTIYNEELDTTVLYLHTTNVKVKYGQKVEAGTLIAHEGSRGSGAPYTHIEVRSGRHTSSNTYRDVTLESTLPYPFFEAALNVQPSEGRTPVTYESVWLLEQERLAAEEEARLEAERIAALLDAPVEEPTPEPEEELLEEDPDQAPFGFSDDQLEPEDGDEPQK